jgi:putative thiamine transport system ATP-binding protein
MSLQVDLHQLGYPGKPLLNQLILSIAAGTIHTLMGASGSGKSSVLSAICGTLPEGLSFTGQIHLNQRRIDTLPTQLRRVGILFQDDLLFAHMTVRENLLFAVPKGATAWREEQVLQALADIEMSDHLHSDPATLSGGQRSRVALARAMLARPEALLLDEPFAKLDLALRRRMRELVFTMVRSRNIPALLVSHDAADVADPALCTQLGAACQPVAPQ